MSTAKPSLVDIAQKHLALLISGVTLLGVLGGWIANEARKDERNSQYQKQVEALEKQVAELRKPEAANPIAARCVEMSREQTQAQSQGRFNDANNIKDAMTGLRCEFVFETLGR